MIFETHNLSAPFDKYIESVFHYKDFMPDHSIERLVPTGHIYIVFELDGITRHTFDNDTLKPNNSFTKVWISGMHRNYISISAHEKSEMFVIQIKAAGAYPFFHMHIESLNEKILPAQEVLGNEMLDLHQDLLKGSTSQDKFAVAQTWLEKRFDSNKEPPSKLLELVEKLQKSSTSNYNEVVEKYENSQKHLIDQFKKYIGLTPKYFQRILRFNELLKKIQNKEKFSWAQVAISCGYSDQSHFIKEFNHFSGFNPQEFIDEQHNQDEPNFFPLDREG